jgi:Chalcone isomerase-like
MKHFGSVQSLLGKFARACRALGLGVAIATAAPLVPAQTVTLGPATFSKSVDLADTTLYLNGAGIRYRFGFKVYAAGLYLQNKATSPEAALTASGPKRVQLVMLREVDGNELGKLFVRGIESNTPKGDDLSEIVPGTGILGDAFAVVFAGGKKLAVGESLGLDFVPGVGTVLSHNGKRVGELIKEPQFFVALMRIWLGQNPADRQLKDAMLGQAASVPAKSSM